MIKPAINSKTKLIASTLIANFLLSWTLLPFLIPPFRGYSPSEFFEVLFWQSIGAVGWPFVLLGVVLSVSFGAKLTNADSLFTLMYPAIQFLLVRSAISRTQRYWELILMHVLVTLSFAVVWYYVLNGYDFMSG
jgi:hypothetical protein